MAASKLALLFFVLASLAVAQRSQSAVAASSQAPAPSQPSNGHGGSQNRTITVDFTSSRLVELRSLRKDGSNIEEIIFFVGFQGFGGQLSVGLYYAALNLSTLSFEQSTYYVEFESITYTGANGTVTQKIDFQNLQWKPLVLTPIGANFDVTAQSQGGEINVTAHVVAQIGSVGGVPVRPTSCKFDVAFKKTSTNNLNLNAKVFSTNELISATESDEQREGFVITSERQISFGANTGFFSWATFATIDGTNVTVQNTDMTPPVNTNTTRQDGSSTRAISAQVTFTFLTQDVGDLVWDPKVGAPDADATGVDTAAIGTATATATAQKSSASVAAFSLALFALASLLF